MQEKSDMTEMIEKFSVDETRITRCIQYNTNTYNTSCIEIRNDIVLGRGCFKEN